MDPFKYGGTVETSLSQDELFDSSFEVLSREVEALVGQIF